VFHAHVVLTALIYDRLSVDEQREFLRPETPLHTNASERDLRGFVIKRKISGGTVSRNGRQARDSMLGLMKTCQKKLGLSFWHYLGDRLGIPDRRSPYCTPRLKAFGPLRLCVRRADCVGTATKLAPLTHTCGNFLRVTDS
jgi:hypothetical protein